MTERYFIGIDGPAGAGKTTTAKAFAEKYDFHYVDTGAFYRAFTVWAKMQPDCFDAKTSQPLEPEIEARINAGKIHVSAVLGSPQQIMLYNDKEIPEHMLRTPEISDLASRLSVMSCVRNLLLYLHGVVGAVGSRCGKKQLPSDICNLLFRKTALICGIDFMHNTAKIALIKHIYT